jgi:hypothetical protein
MIKIKIASLAILLAVLATAANGQSVIQYSHSPGYGYHTEPLYPYASPQRAATRIEKPQIESVEKTPGQKKITKTIILREKPIVRNTYRVVEHPPIVVQREVSEDQESGGQAQAVPRAAPQAASFAGARTIRAEAEITILGPDRMSIRLYRKQDGKTSMRSWQSRRLSPHPSPHPSRH